MAKKAAPRKKERPKDMRLWLSELLNAQREQIEKDLQSESLSPKDRLQILERLFQYVLPKQQATSAKVEFSQMSETQLNDIIDGLASSVLKEP